MTKTEIITAAEIVFDRLSQAGNKCAEDILFVRPLPGKWSPAENIQHLIISTNTTTIAYTAPKFIVRLLAGKPNRASRSFEELENKYYKKLSEGGRASGRFIPKPIEINYGKQKLMDKWNSAAAKFIISLSKNRSEEDLDNYLVKHPLLGRITLRELGYFTIFHTQHHLNGFKKLAPTA